MGLAITRDMGESFWIGKNCRITVSSVSGQRIRLHIEADDDVPIMREELLQQKGPLPLINGKPVTKHERYYPRG